MKYTFTCYECGIELHADTTNREDEDGNSINGSVKDIARDNSWREGIHGRGNGPYTLNWVCGTCIDVLNYC